MQIRQTFRTRRVLVCVLGALLCLPSLTFKARAEQQTSPMLEEKRWAFAFQIENRTGRDIHLRAMEGAERLFDESIPAHPLMPEGNTFPNRRLVRGAYLQEGTEAITIEERLVLKRTETFSIKGFTKTPDLDFLLVVTNEGMKLTQNQELGVERRSEIPLSDQPRFLEQKMLERRVLQEEPFWIVNRSHHDVNIRAYVDGQLALESRLDAENPPGRIARTDEHFPDIPRLESTILISPRAKTLVIEEDLFLKKKQSFDIQELRRKAGMLRLTVSPDGLLLEVGGFVR